MLCSWVILHLKINNSYSYSILILIIYKRIHFGYNRLYRRRLLSTCEKEGCCVMVKHEIKVVAKVENPKSRKELIATCIFFIEQPNRNPSLSWLSFYRPCLHIWYWCMWDPHLRSPYNLCKTSFVIFTDGVDTTHPVPNPRVTYFEGLNVFVWLVVV